MELNSPNFAFLADLAPHLMHQAAMAKHYGLKAPCTALTKLRLFGELLAKNIAARHGVYTVESFQQHEFLRALKYRNALNPKLAQLFHCIRKGYEYEREHPTTEAAAYLGFDKVSDAFAEKMRTVFRLAIRRGQLYRNGKYVGKV